MKPSNTNHNNHHIRKRNKSNNLKLNALKAQIGFGTAFKATLGFYAAQLVATVLVLGAIAVGILLLSLFILK